MAVNVTKQNTSIIICKHVIFETVAFDIVVIFHLAEV